MRALPEDFFEGLTFPPLVLRPGDAVEVTPEQGSGTWPNFALVVNAHGVRGWVPFRVLAGRVGRTVATGPYDTTTLDPADGETLVVVEPDLENGWLWCRDARDQHGWFPINHLAPFE